MAYIALKPCRMAGDDYIAGDVIPDAAVVPEREDALVRMGLIAKTPVPEPHKEPETAKTAVKKTAAAKGKVGGGTR